MEVLNKNDLTILRIFANQCLGLHFWDKIKENYFPYNNQSISISRSLSLWKNLW